MKLELSHYFELEVGDDKFKGYFKDLTKKQKKELDKLIPMDDFKRMKKLTRKLKTANEDEAAKIEEEIDALEEKLSAHDTDGIYKERLKLSISGDDRDDILKVGEEYGYERVLDTIISDIAQRREKN